MHRPSWPDLPVSARLLLATFALLAIAPHPSSGQDFVSITTGPVVSDGGWNYGCAWADYDGDGYLDLFVVDNDASDKNNFLYRNLGNGTFEKITDLVVVNDGGSSYGCTYGDIDNDGDLDLFVSNYNENNFLYENQGDGTFQAVSSGPVVSQGGSSAGCSFADYDGDGHVDLVVCNRTSVNFLYHNEGGGTFTRVYAGAVATDNANSSGCAWSDYDGDGDQDLVVANAGPAPNALYRNEGGGVFLKVTEGAVVTDVASSTGASWGDMDNDGDQDLYVPSGVLGSDYNHLYENLGNGTFDRVVDGPVATDFNWAGGSGWSDIDLDGDLDLLAGGYDGNNLLYLNDGMAGFTPVTSGAVVTTGNYTMGVAWCDYDTDGDTDLFLAKNNYFGGNNVLLRNDLDSGTWLQVVCEGTLSNGAGIGARVDAYSTGGATGLQTRQITAQTGGGNSAQGDMAACFGLNGAAQLDSLVVRWPSGLVERWTEVAAGQRRVVVEGSTTAVRVAQAPMGATLVLEPNVPNPFNPATTIRFNVDRWVRASLRIYDVEGRLVRTLLDRAPIEPGTHAVRWNGIDEADRAVPSGVYLCRLEAGADARVRRLVLAR